MDSRMEAKIHEETVAFWKSRRRRRLVGRAGLFLLAIAAGMVIGELLARM